MCALYNLFVKHNILPDEFYEKSHMARRTILAFSSFEFEMEEKARKAQEKRGG